MPSAIVTGATGITGSAIVQHLLKDPFYEKIYTFSRSNPGHHDPKIEHVSLDLQGSVQDMAKAVEHVSTEYIYLCAYLVPSDRDRFMKNAKPSFDLTVINPDIITGPMIHPIHGPKSINETNHFAIASFIDGSHTQIEGVTFPFYHFVGTHIDAEWSTFLAAGQCSFRKAEYLSLRYREKTWFSSQKDIGVFC